MAQPFDCVCGKLLCRGRIAGAKAMTSAQLEGVWLNGHIRQLLDEQRGTVATASEQPGAAVGRPGNGRPAAAAGDADPTAQALRDALQHAEKVVEAARAALRSYAASAYGAVPYAAASYAGLRPGNHALHPYGLPQPQFAPRFAIDAAAGSVRRGPTSRELSGEMGGDTRRADMAYDQ